MFTAAPAVLDAFKDTVEGYKLQSMGVILSYICPLMYMNNPLCKKKAVITNSNKLRTYTSARYYTDDGDTGHPHRKGGTADMQQFKGRVVVPGTVHRRSAGQPRRLQHPGQLPDGA